MKYLKKINKGSSSPAGSAVRQAQLTNVIQPKVLKKNLYIRVLWSF